MSHSPTASTVRGRPRPPIRTKLEISTDQIMLGGRPVQNVAADLHSDTRSWTVDALEFQLFRSGVAVADVQRQLRRDRADPGERVGFAGDGGAQ